MILLQKRNGDLLLFLKAGIFLGGGEIQKSQGGDLLLCEYKKKKRDPKFEE